MEINLIKYLLLNNELPLTGVGLLKIKYEPAYIENNFLVPANQSIQLLKIENAQINALINFIAENDNISIENAHLNYENFINNNFTNSTNSEFDMFGIGYFYKNDKNNWCFEQKLLNNFKLDPIKLNTLKRSEIKSVKKSHTWVLIAMIIAALSIISILLRFLLFIN